MPRTGEVRVASKKNALREKRRSEQRRKRIIWTIAGIVGAAILVVLALVAFSPKPSAPVAAGSFVTPVPVDWTPTPGQGKSTGPADAKVVVTEFADFQCPFCKKWHDDVLSQLVTDYVKTGKVRFEYRHLIVIDGNTGGNESRRSAIASECAMDQGRFWDFYNMLYENQGAEASGAFSDDRLRAFAATLKLDTNAFNSCLNSAATAQRVEADQNAAISKRLDSTPSVLINGVKADSPMDYNKLKGLIDAALRAAGE